MDKFIIYIAPCSTPRLPSLEWGRARIGYYDHCPCQAAMIIIEERGDGAARRAGSPFSKTHFDMSDQAWEELNHACHSSVFGGAHNPMDPRWVERLSAQRDNLVHLAKEGLLPRR